MGAQAQEACSAEVAISVREAVRDSTGKPATRRRRRYRRKNRLHHRFERKTILGQQLLWYMFIAGAAFFSTKMFGGKLDDVASSGAALFGDGASAAWPQAGAEEAATAAAAGSHGQYRVLAEVNATLLNATWADDGGHCKDKEVGTSVLVIRPVGKACNMNNYSDVCDYPDDGFDADDREAGALAVHILGVAFMFLGLAIICDEYFETALEGICEALDLKEDVAGATFMAAGGSAPELFTSIMGTFFAKSDIGFGTIVGSAVFNVLFVIAMCAFVTDNLQLTWWPLTRDSSYYCASILVLVMVVVDNEVYWYEAIILLICYGGYVTVMYFNEELEKYVGRKLAENDEHQGYGRVGAILLHIVSQSWFDNLMLVVIFSNIGVIIVELGNLLNFPLDVQCNTDLCLQYALCVDSEVHLLKGSVPKIPTDGQWATILDACVGYVGNGLKDGLGNGQGSEKWGDFTQSQCDTADTYAMLNTVFSILYISEMLAKWVAYGFWGYWRDPLNLFDGILVLLIIVELGLSGQSATGALRGLRGLRFLRTLRALRVVRLYRMLHVEKMDASTQTDSEDFRRPSLMQQGGHKVLTGKSSGGANKAASVVPVDDAETGQLEDSSAGETRAAEPANGEEAADGGGDDDDDDDDDGPVDPFDIPDDIGGKIYWLIAFPLSFAMFLTVPDCRREGWEKVFPLTFFACIVWITGLSYVMVWMTTVIGDFFGIPDAVMGLTLLASGTSIPDLLSSVAVAKRGFGDMAVSSSIGSNVFDILIGLPIPWLVYGILNGAPVPIGSDGLTVMVLTLFIMVAAVISIIHMSKWLMTTRLGIYMVILYIMFVALSLMLEYGLV